jgi:hypothetical protein
MRQGLIGTIAILFVMLSSAVMAAQGRGKAAGPKAPTATAQGPRTTGSGPKATTRGPKTTSGAKPASAGGPKAARADTKRTTAARTTAVPPTTTSTTTSPAQPKSPALVERLRMMLPAGTDMSLAAAGFKNQGQFVAAVQVSRNLGIPFAELKTRMIIDQMSLGQAIQDVRPTVDGDGEARRATRQADDALKSTDDAARRPRP